MPLPPTGLVAVPIVTPLLMSAVVAPLPCWRISMPRLAVLSSVIATAPALPTVSSRLPLAEVERVFNPMPAFAVAAVTVMAVELPGTVSVRNAEPSPISWRMPCAYVAPEQVSAPWSFCCGGVADGLWHSLEACARVSPGAKRRSGNAVQTTAARKRAFDAIALLPCSPLPRASGKEKPVVQPGAA